MKIFILFFSGMLVFWLWVIHWNMGRATCRGILAPVKALSPVCMGLGGWPGLMPGDGWCVMAGGR